MLNLQACDRARFPLFNLVGLHPDLSGTSSSLYPGTLPIFLMIPEDPKPDLLPLILQIGIWARPSAIDEGQGDYALNVTGPILNFFAQHYNTSYPLPKSGK